VPTLDAVNSSQTRFMPDNTRSIATVHAKVDIGNVENILTIESDTLNPTREKPHNNEDNQDIDKPNMGN
jgi:hypothetical protein